MFALIPAHEHHYEHERHQRERRHDDVPRNGVVQPSVGVYAVHVRHARVAEALRRDRVVHDLRRHRHLRGDLGRVGAEGFQSVRRGVAHVRAGVALRVVEVETVVRARAESEHVVLAEVRVRTARQSVRRIGQDARYRQIHVRHERGALGQGQARRRGVVEYELTVRGGHLVEVRQQFVPTQVLHGHGEYELFAVGAAQVGAEVVGRTVAAQQSRAVEHDVHVHGQFVPRGVELLRQCKHRRHARPARERAVRTGAVDVIVIVVARHPHRGVRVVVARAYHDAQVVGVGRLVRVDVHDDVLRVETVVVRGIHRHALFLGRHAGQARFQLIHEPLRRARLAVVVVLARFRASERRAVGVLRNETLQRVAYGRAVEIGRAHARIGHGRAAARERERHDEEGRGQSRRHYDPYDFFHDDPLLNLSAC